MINKIIVQNNFRVEKVIGITINRDEDLLLNNNVKVKKFIKKYFNYLNSCKEKDMIDFFKMTGLILGHEYIEKRSLNRIYFSSSGAYSHNFDRLKNKPYTYNHHLIIETYVDNLEICMNKIMANKKEIYLFENIEEIDVDQFRWKLSMLDTNERIKYLQKNNYLLPNTNDIKNVLLDSFGNVLSLKENGNMYINNYLYGSEIDYIFELNSKDMKIIYKNMSVEDYSSHCASLIYKKYNKVLYNENYLATLENGTLCIYLYLNLNYNKSIYLRFDQVTDIEYVIKSNILIIIKDDKSISLPLDSVMMIS